MPFVIGGIFIMFVALLGFGWPALVVTLVIVFLAFGVGTGGRGRKR
jgi:hypothetical protein